MQRNEILEALSVLLPAAFEAVVFKVAIPPDILSGTQTPQKTRAVEVIRHLESQGRLLELVGLLRPGAPEASLPMPEPVYENEEVRELAQGLERARVRRRTLLDAGVSTEAMDREILSLRSRLRRGGQLRAGDKLGDRYVLLRQIGRGGFASVWEAVDGRNNNRVAVKVLHPDQARDESRRERFFRGARVMAELDHPGVVRVTDPHGEDDGWFFFAMELVRGEDLHHAVVGGRLALVDAVPLILRIAEALGAAHRKGLVHRDVKPANILLGEDGEHKLTDFDLVAADDTTGGTRTGHMGTLLFMAPEPSNRATARTDVYALGMTTIFCLHGRELHATAMRHLDQVIAALPCEQRMKAVLMTAIEVEPKKRYPDATAFAKALQQSAPAKVRGRESAHSQVFREEMRASLDRVMPTHKPSWRWLEQWLARREHVETLLRSGKKTDVAHELMQMAVDFGLDDLRLEILAAYRGGADIAVFSELTWKIDAAMHMRARSSTASAPPANAMPTRARSSAASAPPVNATPTRARSSAASAPQEDAAPLPASSFVISATQRILGAAFLVSVIFAVARASDCGTCQRG